MNLDPTFKLETALAKGLRELLELLEQSLDLKQPLQVYLAGGMAVHLYTGSRVTSDIDAEFAGRVILPSDLAVVVHLEDGSEQVVYLDTNYNPTFALMHEDYQEDSRRLHLGLGQIRVNVLSPVDLAVSKIARLADNDREDIRQLVRLGLTNADEIEKRASEAIGGYVGGMEMLKMNLRDAVALARDAEAESRPPAGSPEDRTPQP
ncbi:DUF6036 family nucleotidyltransferase [Burkholderia cenocepacia]|uniref:DUF6036 family nucleotidyltransferase n=1 Tax=Burkholderia cenocepacia TaxID=95486 RepID=UPI001B9AF42A|nr:DUF6036 family nucleotidyltransferase [Burkholderia cenocepacia]MBR8426218.1 hypothetical protein [Burkholderia cenocepacia]